MGTTEKKPHILVLSASTGGGHMRAAEGIEKCLLERHPSIDVTNVDMMNHVSWLFRTLYVDSYMDMMKHHRRLYELLYTMMDKEPEKMPMQRFRLWLQWLNSVSAHKALLKLGPDHIICTHFTAAEMLSRARRKGYNIPPTSVVVTDFDVHWMWIHRALDEFFVADHEAAARLATRGVAEEHIHVTGIPVCPGFARTYDAQEQKKALGLTPGTLTLMLMAGGFGVSSIDRTARRLLGHFGHLQLIAVAGRNEALRASLDRVAAEFPGRLAAIGFTTEVEKYMAASDLIISKPGGLTTSECMALGKPMIMIDPIPGQEQHNATYLMERGAAMMAYDEIGIIYRLEWILRGNDHLARMQQAAQRVGKPRAGYDILKVITERYFNGK